MECVCVWSVCGVCVCMECVCVCGVCVCGVCVCVCPHNLPSVHCHNVFTADCKKS